MATYRIANDGLKRLLSMALKTDGTAILSEWQARLDQGIVTDEMRAVFAARGWLSSVRDARLQEEDVSEVKDDTSDDPTLFRETATEPRRGRNRQPEGEDNIEGEDAVREAPDGTSEVPIRES